MRKLYILIIMTALVSLACSVDESRDSQADVSDATTELAEANQKVTLDGKTFITDFYEPENENPSIDTLSFAHGTCHSTMCDYYGFSKAGYSVTEVGETVHFTATTISETDGEMEWRGAVAGEKIEGDVVWNKEGQEPITYRFSGVLQ